MSEAQGREIGQALLDHPDHEIYDEASPGEILMAERFVKAKLPPSYRGMLLVGGGGILANGDLLLGTKDPEELNATLHEVARALWEEGLERRYLPIVDGEHFFAFDLESADAEGECQVVELDPESHEELRRLGSFAEFARSVLL